ncbi:hypothetical protein HFP43_25090 [Streptomyces sp. SJ1-7]|nr:hypothetical protein [Streptomyces sp. SJ1-7]
MSRGTHQGGPTHWGPGLHPGYGFASENPDLAEVREDHGSTSVGPSAPVIDRLGDKVSARALMAEAGLPLLPGGVEPAACLEEARALAVETGYPLVIKPVAGGAAGTRRWCAAPASRRPSTVSHAARRRACSGTTGSIRSATAPPPGTSRSRCSVTGWAISSTWGRRRCSGPRPPSTQGRAPSTSWWTTPATSTLWRSTAVSRWNIP